MVFRSPTQKLEPHTKQIDCVIALPKRSCLDGYTMAFRPLIQTLVEPPYKTIIHSGSESVLTLFLRLKSQKTLCIETVGQLGFLFLRSR